MLQMVQAMEKASGKKVGPLPHPPHPTQLSAAQQLWPFPLTSPVGTWHCPVSSACLAPSTRCLRASRCSALPRLKDLAGSWARAGSAKLQLPPVLQIPYKVVARREGDVAACYANPSLAHEELGWTAALGLDRMCECWLDPCS